MEGGGEADSVQNPLHLKFHWSSLSRACGRPKELFAHKKGVTI